MKKEHQKPGVRKYWEWNRQESVSLMSCLKDIWDDQETPSQCRASETKVALQDVSNIRKKKRDSMNYPVPRQWKLSKKLMNSKVSCQWLCNLSACHSLLPSAMHWRKGWPESTECFVIKWPHRTSASSVLDIWGIFKIWLLGHGQRITTYFLSFKQKFLG